MLPSAASIFNPIGSYVRSATQTWALPDIISLAIWLQMFGNIKGEGSVYNGRTLARRFNDDIVLLHCRIIVIFPMVIMDFESYSLKSKVQFWYPIRYFDPLSVESLG